MKAFRQEKRRNEVNLRENARILIDVLRQTEDEENGIRKISKYFTKGLLHHGLIGFC